MSDINTYADETAIAGLSPINGDLVLNQADSSLYLCTNADATGIARWKKFASNSAAVLYPNRWGASFDAGDSLDVPNISALNGVANASYSFWYKTSTTGTVGLVGGGAGTSAYHWNTGSMLYVHSFVNTLSHGIPIPTLGSWHHVVCTFEAAGSKLYVDGVYKSLVDHGDTTASNAFTDFTVGNVPYYSISAGQKSVDAVAFWSATLSDGGGLTIGDTAGGDIAQIYNSGVPKDLTLASAYDTDRTSNLVGYWRMGDDSNDTATSGGSIATITDSSGNGNHATQSDVTNQPTFADLTGETIYN